MEEKNRFQSDILYDLPLHQEFTKLYRETYGMNAFFRTVTVLCLVYFLPTLKYSYNRWLFFVLCCVIGVPRLLQIFKQKKGDLDWQRVMHQNNGTPPRSVVTLEETGIRSRKQANGSEMYDPYGQVVRIAESRNLLLVMTKLRVLHLIDKRTLIGGTQEELIAHLRQNCPKLKKKIKTGRLHRITETIMWGVMLLGLILSLAYTLHIPEKLRGQVTIDMSYAEIAEELRPMGIDISQEAIDEMEQFDTNNWGNALLDASTKVMNLLCWEGQGLFEEVEFAPNAFDLRWTPSYSGVYWFDLEVFGFGNIYSNFLTGISAMDSSLVFTNVEEFYGVDILEGQGDIPVSFDYLGEHYEFEAQYNYDWFDTDMIYYLGQILAADEDPQNLWYTLDGQGILLYYGTEENKNLLEKKTGIDFFDCVTIRIGY